MYVVFVVCVMCVVCVVMYMSACAQAYQKSVWSAGAGVTGVRKSPDVGAENSV